MANIAINSRLQQRNDTAGNWTSVNPILLKGELGLETDTNKIKIGDGVKTWTQLVYANVTPAELSGGDYIPTTEKGVANGVATLDVAGKVPSTQLPSYVDDVVEAANLAALNALPAGEKVEGKIYVAIDTNIAYRWSGTVFVAVSNPIDIATQAEAETGTDNAKMMTPLRVKQSITVNLPTSLPPSGSASGDLSGSYPAPTIGAKKVTAAKIADATITDTQMANASLNVAKLFIAGGDVLILTGGNANG